MIKNGKDFFEFIVYSLTDPDILTNEIIENIESGLNSFREIMKTINRGGE